MSTSLISTTIRRAALLNLLSKNRYKLSAQILNEIITWVYHMEQFFISGQGRNMDNCLRSGHLLAIC